MSGDSIHANAIEVGSGFFRGLCYNSTSKLLSPVGAVGNTAICFKENYYICFVSFLP
jgi:hypothetical protein